MDNQTKHEYKSSVRKVDKSFEKIYAALAEIRGYLHRYLGQDKYTEEVQESATELMNEVGGFRNNVLRKLLK